MISPKLHDISPFFLLIFSLLRTADFFILLRLPGDGYSLLCSKNSLRGTVTVVRLFITGFLYYNYLLNNLLTLSLGGQGFSIPASCTGIWKYLHSGTASAAVLVFY
jgi:hypothetical protein